MGNRFLKLAFATLAILAVTAPARASLEMDLVNRWYALLGKADANALSGLMARSAKVQLVDLGVTQTKQEFLDSMSQFAEAIRGGSIRYKIEKVSANTATALVCYHFPSNDKLTRESFTFRQGLVATSVQEPVAENCNGLPQ